jgi:tetratricopeptide (TPR) repeat protein
MNSENIAGTKHGIAGLAYAFQKDYGNAEKSLKLATSQPDARGVEWTELAYYYVCTNQMPKAESAIQQAKALETFPARSMRMAGELYRTAGLFDKAIQEFSGSTSLEEYAPGFRQKAVTEIALGQWQSALLDLQKSEQLNPVSSTTQSWLALAEDHLGNKDASLKDINAAFKDSAPPPVVYKNKAAVELNDGALAQAMNDINQALKMDPWLKEAYEVRAQIYAKQGAKSKSDEDNSKAKQLVSHLDL